MTDPLPKSSGQQSSEGIKNETDASGCLLIIGFIGLVFFVCWLGGAIGDARRSKMTPAQRASEDRELDHQERYPQEEDNRWGLP